MLKKDILRGKKVFDSIYKKGKSVGGKYVVIFYKKNGLSFSRFAFLASKKVGNSVQRNRAVRLMREAHRLRDFQIQEGYDIIYIARHNILEANYDDVKKSIFQSIKKTGVVR